MKALLSVSVSQIDCCLSGAALAGRLRGMETHSYALTATTSCTHCALTSTLSSSGCLTAATAPLSFVFLRLAGTTDADEEEMSSARCTAASRSGTSLRTLRRSMSKGAHHRVPRCWFLFLWTKPSRRWAAVDRWEWEAWSIARSGGVFVVDFVLLLAMKIGIGRWCRKWILEMGTVENIRYHFSRIIQFEVMNVV